MLKNEALIDDMQNLLDYESIKDYLFMQVINVDTNRELLNEIPYTIIGDLAITYHIMIQSTDKKYCSARVTNSLLNTYGIDVEELHKDAEISSPKMMVPTVGTITSIVFGISDDLIQDNSDSHLYIITNEHGTDGASVIFYPNILNDLAQKLGHDLFIIPSSTDECLAVCDCSSTSAAHVQNVLRDINKEVVSKDKKLSDTLYHYSKDEHKLEKADDFEKRIHKNRYSQFLS